MISLLQDIIDSLICWIETGVILFTNLLISGIAAVVAAIVGILPSMPTIPSVPSWFTDGYNYVAYWFPVDYCLALGATLLTLYLAWLAISLILRWAKVVGGNA